MYFLKSTLSARPIFGLLLLLCITFFQSCESCTGNTTVYRYFTTTVTHQGAIDACKLASADHKTGPAALQTEGEYIRMVNQMTGIIKEYAWTSGYREKAGEPFHWKLGNGSTVPFTFTKWAYGIPPADNVTGCVLVVPTQDGLAWKVADCGYYSYAICQLC